MPVKLSPKIKLGVGSISQEGLVSLQVRAKSVQIKGVLIAPR